ncbi:hypothetical protein T492DRAFT_842666 [Pavlovales sp. CCMP2436]|nr:hypothetical protein T492DRAFT_842666 [Pavlovales sp. CCMP2436]
MQTFGQSKVKNRTLPYISEAAEKQWVAHCQSHHKRNLKRVKPAIDNKWGGKKNGVTDPKMRTYTHLSSNGAKARREDGPLSRAALIPNPLPFSPLSLPSPATEPAYPVDKLEAERRETETLLKSISHYPYQAGSWAKERREKTKLLELKGPVERASSSPTGPSAHLRTRPTHSAPAELQMRPDADGMITFEIMTGGYLLPSGDYEIPLSGNLPLTVSMENKSVLALSSASAAGSTGGFTVHPHKGKTPKKGTPARR